MSKMQNNKQVSSEQIPLYNKYQSMYEKLKINNLLPIDQMDPEKLKAALGEEIDDNELDHFILFIILHEDNDRLKESLLKKDQALKALFKRLTYAKRDVAKNTIESQLQLLFSYMIGERVLDLYDTPMEIKKYFHSFFKETEKQLAKLQINSMELYPVSLDELGVIPAIKSYYKHKKMHDSSYLLVNFLGSLQRYDANTEIMIFRYVQQVMDTIDRDTDATELSVHFHEEDNGLIICSFTGNKGYIDLSEHKDFIMFNEVINSFSGRVEHKTATNSFEIKFFINGNLLGQ